MSEDFEHLRQWVGRKEVRQDVASAWPLTALAATLDDTAVSTDAGAPIPPGWHWIFFLDAKPPAELGSDGHPKRGGFLPPVPLPRRMWAGGRLEFLRPLRVGEAVSRTSRIVDVSSKEGRTGPLGFVLVRHEVAGAEGVALIEEQDIVYRENSRPGDPTPTPLAAPKEHDWAREIRPDPVLLFRYSALTFNGHRIH